MNGTNTAEWAERMELSTQLLKARRLRERDAIQREQLGLRADGLQYSADPEGWREPPRERYVDARGRAWVKYGNCDYRLLMVKYD